MSDDLERLESRAMLAGMVGNLAMGVAGVLAAYLSQSQAVLVDGMFSMIGFTAALLGRRVTRNARRGPDRVRPYGYAGDEAIFVTFRALSLLGLVLFALAGAGMNIARYLQGGAVPELIVAPLYVYFTFIGALCAALWAFHRYAWIRSGRTSEVLRLESKAAAFDGLITGAAAVGILGIQYFRDGFLAPVAPVGDSLIVLALCSVVLFQYWRDFLSGLGELAGVTAAPARVADARRAARPVLQRDAGYLVDLSVSKMGRQFTVVLYYDPLRPISAEDTDALTVELQSGIGGVLPGAEVIMVISRHGRAMSVPEG